MATPHAMSGEVIPIEPLGDRLLETASRALVVDDTVEVIRVVLLAGDRLPLQKANGPVIIQCVEGAVSVNDQDEPMRSHGLCYFAQGLTQDIQALEDASLLLTFLRHKRAS